MIIVKISEINIENYKELDSTNEKAKELAANGAKEYTTVVADRQTAGKGTRDRSFFSEGGLYMTVILRPDMPLNNVTLLTLYTAVCVHKAIRKICRAEVSIKWVNDILSKNGKVCGILCESICQEQGNMADSVVVGIGINLSNVEFPKELLGIASSLAISEEKVDRVKKKLIMYILKQLKQYRKALSNRRFLTYYRSSCGIIDKKIKITGRGNDYTAVVLGISDNGELMVISQRGAELLNYGEVSIMEISK